MKKYILLTGVGLIIFSGLGYMAGSLKYLKKEPVQIVAQKKEEIKKIDYDLSLLIDKTKEDIDGRYIESIDMNGLKELYKDMKAESIPYVFVEKIPEDFKVEKVSDKTLFMKLFKIQTRFLSKFFFNLNQKI